MDTQSESNGLLPQPGAEVNGQPPVDASVATTPAVDTQASTPLNPLVPGGVSVEGAAATQATRQGQMEANANAPKSSFWDKVKNVIPIKATPAVQPAVPTQTETPFTAQTIPANQMDEALKSGSNVIVEKAPDAIAAVKEAESIVSQAQQPPVDAPSPTSEVASSEPTAEFTPPVVPTVESSTSTAPADSSFPPHLEGGQTPKMEHVTDKEHADAESAPSAPKFGEAVTASLAGTPAEESTSSALVGETIDDDKPNNGTVEVVDPMHEKPDLLAVDPPIANAPSSGLGDASLAPIDGLSEKATADVNDALNTGFNTAPEAADDTEAKAAVAEADSIVSEAQKSSEGLPLETISGVPVGTGSDEKEENSSIEEATTAKAFGITAEESAAPATENSPAPVALDTAVEPEAHEDPAAQVTASGLGTPPTPVAPPAPAYDVVAEAAKTADAAGAGSLTSNAIQDTAVNAWNAPLSNEGLTPSGAAPTASASPVTGSSGLGIPESQSSGLGSSTEPTPAGVGATSPLPTDSTTR